MTDVAGIVLCGGRSSRMGRSKAWLPFGGEPMLARVVRLLTEAAAPIVVVAAVEQDLPPLPNHVVVVRDPEPDRGPLQGLAAGLAAVPSRFVAAYVTACDVPFLRPEFVRRMVQLLGDAMACVPSIDGRLHPLAAVYRLEILPIARQLLLERQTRLTRVCESAPTRIVTADEVIDVDKDFWSLKNLNTREDYEAAIQLSKTARL